MPEVDAGGPTAPVPEVEEFLTWLALERGRAPATVSAYRRDLGAYTAFLADRGVGVRDVAHDDVLAFLWARREELAPASLTRQLVAVRSLHRYLASEGVVATDPTADVELPRVPQGLPKALGEAEVERLLDAVEGDNPVARRDRALLELLYGTGARISEAVGLSLSDVDLTDGLARLLGKGDKERIVPLGRCARGALASWLAPAGRGAMEPERWRSRDDAEAVFVNQRGGRLRRQGAWGIVRKHALAVGLGAKLSPHVLRHSCATHMIDHGADIRTVQELLGHASISTTQVYTHVSRERIWAVYRAAHPRALSPKLRS